MYSNYLKEKFPHDEANGLYRFPKLPAVKLGKALMKDTRIASPTDVLAMHLNEGIFGTELLLFTKNKCYYEGGEFLLEDVKEVQEKGKKLIVFVNQKGQFVPHELKVKNEQVATTLKKVLEGAGRYDPTAEALVQQTYEGKGYNDAEIAWLKLRDEILRTIDLLYDRYNEGKLSMLEYEEKKAELLDRL